MAPLTTNSEVDHTALLDKLDFYQIPKPFKNPNWKPPTTQQKREANARGRRTQKAASAAATQQNSGVVTPNPAGSSDDDKMDTEDTIAVGVPSTSFANGAAKEKIISEIVSTQRGEQPMDWELTDEIPPPHLVEEAGERALATQGPPATFGNIDAAPSTHAGRRCKKYSDITGRPAPYTHPKSHLHYTDAEEYGVIRGMNQAQVEERLALRNAHTVLK